MSNSTNQTQDRCQQEIERDFILQTAFLILIMVVTFLGNFMVCLVVYLHRRLRTVTNYFIVSLAVSDLLISVLSVPFRIHQTLHNGVYCLNTALCWTWLLTDLTCACASICNLAAISVDRYIAIVHPFRYHSLMTTRVGWAVIAMVWTYSVAWAALSSFNWTNFGEEHIFTHHECRNSDKIFYTVVTTMDFYVPLLIVLIMYGLVFRVAMNQARAVASLQPTSNRDRRGRRFSINIVKEVKAAKTLAIVIGAFVICWFPFFTLLLISLWKLELLTALSSQTLLGLRGTFTYVLPTINSTLNPIIYALFNRDFRSAFCRLLERTFGSSCSRSNNNSNVDESQYSMKTAVTNASPKGKLTKNGSAKKTKFHEVYGEEESGAAEEPKPV